MSVNINTKNDVWQYHKKYKFETKEIMNCIFDTLTENTDNPQFDDYDVKQLDIANDTISFIIKKQLYFLKIEKV